MLPRRGRREPAAAPRPGGGGWRPATALPAGGLQAAEPWAEPQPQAFRSRRVGADASAQEGDRCCPAPRGPHASVRWRRLRQSGNLQLCNDAGSQRTWETALWHRIRCWLRVLYVSRVRVCRAGGPRRRWGTAVVWVATQNRPS